MQVKSRTSISIDPELLEKAKAARLNVSQLATDAIRAKLEKQNPNTLAIFFDMERVKVRKQREDLNAKERELEEKAKTTLGMSLDDYLNQEDLQEENRWIEAKTLIIQRLRINKSLRSKTKYEIANIYSKLMSDYGVTGQDQVRVVEESLKEVEAEGIYQ